MAQAINSAASMERDMRLFFSAVERSPAISGVTATCMRGLSTGIFAP
jgi:hypothetical protein